MWQVFRYGIFVAAMVIMLVAAMAAYVFYGQTLSAAQSRAQSELDYIAAGVQGQGMAFLQGVPSFSEGGVVWLSEQGQPLFESAPNVASAQPNGEQSYIEQEYVKQAFDVGQGKEEGYSVSLTQRAVSYAQRLQDGSVVCVSLVFEGMLGILLSMAWPILAAFLAGVGLCFFIAWCASKSVAKQLSEIDLQEPSEELAYEELAPLISRINTQKRQLNERISQLKRQKQEFDTITENMQEGILVLDKDANIISHNRAMLLLMNIAPPKGKQSIYEINRSEPFRVCVAGALSGKHMEQMVKVRERVCQIFANPVMQEEKVAGIVIVLFDVTEREKREALRREFTANVSHELKTPLTSISGFAEIIKNGMVMQEDIPKFATNIYNEAQRLILLVRDILNLSEIDEKQMLLQKQEVELLALAKDVVHSLSPIAQERGITLNTTGRNVVIYGSAQILHEMVYNLCDNAIKYNTEGGSVAISVQKQGDAAVLSVADTGMGIDPVNHDRVFERFYRVNESRSSEIPGSGLGMSIVKHGAQLHGAHVEINSALGKGTKITLRFAAK